MTRFCPRIGGALGLLFVTALSWLHPCQCSRGGARPVILMAIAASSRRMAS